MSNQGIVRITKEVSQIQKGSDLSIAVACLDSDVRHVKALIIGPPGTPYEYGFFDFALKFGSDYPSKPPKVDARTTNNGRCRFNPNIYAGGKVCLSILGTWQGEKPGEDWSSAQGLESILWSIQSLMSSNPYENEPGFENLRSDHDKKANEAYCAKIRHETIRIAVIQVLESAFGIQADGTSTRAPPSALFHSSDSDDDRGSKHESSKSVEKTNFEPFKDLYKRRFLWYYETYLNTVEGYVKKNKDGSTFERMPFEGEGNQMKGQFEYSGLRRRLVRLKEVIDNETCSWAEDGLQAKRHETGLSANLQRQFEQLTEHNRLKGKFNVNIELENQNPFVWLLTYFGRPMTHLDGGIFKLRVHISTRFPDEQPRVKVETPMYHHRVSKEGVLCYFVKKPEELKSHIEALVEAIEEESPPFDPRTIVHPEATKLLWGTAEDKKKYYRHLRRSAQRSVEEL